MKLRVWNCATKRVKLYSCNKFTDSKSFEKAINQGTTVRGDAFVLRTYLDRVLSNANNVLENINVKSFEDFEKFLFGRTKQFANLYNYIDGKIDECEMQQQFSYRDI